MAGSRMPQVAVVIISFNTAKLTVQAVESVLQSKDVQVSLYIVDNASTDRSVVQLKRKLGLHKDEKALDQLKRSVRLPGIEERYPGVVADSDTVRALSTARVGKHDVVLLELGENLGFGRANNLIAAGTVTPFIWFLNSDTVVKPSTLADVVHVFPGSGVSSKRAVTKAQKQKIDSVGIVSSALYSADGSPQSQGGALPNLRNVARWILFVDTVPFLARLAPPYQHRAESMRLMAKRGVAKVGWVGGTAMLVSRQCLDEIGGFDPAIFMYAEDIDLCWRANMRHYDVVWVQRGHIIHFGSASSTSRNAILGEIKGLVYLWQKHRTPLEVVLLRALLRIGLWVRVAVFGILRQYGRQRVYKEALVLV